MEFLCTSRVTSCHIRLVGNEHLYKVRADETLTIGERIFIILCREKISFPVIIDSVFSSMIYVEISRERGMLHFATLGVFVRVATVVIALGSACLFMS